MSDTQEFREILRPAAGVISARYQVTVREIVTREVHEQTWTVVVPEVQGRPRMGDVDAVPSIPGKMGHVTVCKTVKSDSVLFEAQFSTPPKISALALLLEGNYR